MGMITEPLNSSTITNSLSAERSNRRKGKNRQHSTENQSRLNKLIQKNEQQKTIRKCKTSMSQILHSYAEASRELAKHDISNTQSNQRLVEETSARRRTIFWCSMGAAALAGTGGAAAAAGMGVSAVATATMHQVAASVAKAAGDLGQGGCKVVEQGAHGFSQDANINVNTKLGPEAGAQSSNKQAGTETSRNETDLTGKIIEGEKNAFAVRG